VVISEHEWVGRDVVVDESSLHPNNTTMSKKEVRDKTTFLLDMLDLPYKDG
jgi:hypothetical protein